MQWHAAPCSAMQRHAAPCSAMQRHAAPCSAMQRHAAPCSAMQRHAVSQVFPGVLLTGQFWASQVCPVCCTKLIYEDISRRQKPFFRDEYLIKVFLINKQPRRRAAGIMAAAPILKIKSSPLKLFLMLPLSGEP
jgi:hypothetical protein